MNPQLDRIRNELLDVIRDSKNAEEREYLFRVLEDASVALDIAMEEKTPPRELAPPPVDRTQQATIHGGSVDEVRAEQQAEGNKLHRDYIILSDEERAKGFVRPVRRSYRHVGIPGPKHPLRDLTPEEAERYAGAGYVKFEQYPEGSHATGMLWTQAKLDAIGKGCQAATTMGAKLAETYARDPKFYGSTMCSTCGSHYPVGERGEFVWVDNPEERVGT